MGTIIVGGLVTLLQNMTNGILTMLAQFLTSYAQQASTMLNQSWVQTAIQIMQALAASLFTLKVAWEALSRYVLWNEGNSDTDGGQVWKGTLRVAIFGSASFWLVSNIFQVGINLGKAFLMSASMNKAIVSLNNYAINEGGKRDIDTCPVLSRNRDCSRGIMDPRNRHVSLGRKN
jgi:hypothetical protein